MVLSSCSITLKISFKAFQSLDAAKVHLRLFNSISSCVNYLFGEASEGVELSLLVRNGPNRNYGNES